MGGGLRFTKTGLQGNGYTFRASSSVDLGGLFFKPERMETPPNWEIAGGREASGNFQTAVA